VPESMNSGTLAVGLVILLCVIVAGGSIVWNSLRTGISPMPSSRNATLTMLGEVGTADAGPIIDPGSGWGTVVIATAKKYPQRQVIGYELSPIPWLISVLRKHLCRTHNLSLYRVDFLKADLSNATTLLCYLFPGGMRALEKKLHQEENKIQLVISNTFALPSHEPAKVIKLNDIYTTPIYVYHRSGQSSWAGDKSTP